MNQYNITAHVYNLFDNYKQTILMNEIVSATSKDQAIEIFKEIFEIDHKIIKIFSAEPI